MTWNSTATVSNPDVQRTNIIRETKVYPVPLTQMRVWDAMSSLLPAAAANDDCGLVTGTPGTDAPTIQAGDIGGATSSRKFAFEFPLPPEYDDGQAVSVRVSGGMVTTVCDASCTIDFEVWKITRAGAVGSDLSTTTAATSINSLTHADIDFVITATGLVSGEKLIANGTIAYDDAGNAGVMIPEIVTVEMVLSVKG